MIRRKYLIVMVFLLISLVLTTYGYGLQQDDADSSTFTWQDLQKLLELNADKIKISWQEFKKLLVQSGNQVKMNFAVKNGVVTLTREQFRKILTQMKYPVRKILKPPAGYRLVKPVTLEQQAQKAVSFERNLKYTFLNGRHLPISKYRSLMPE